MSRLIPHFHVANPNVPGVSFTQFFCPYAGVVLGKIATINPNSGDMNEFAHGKGDSQFMNTSLNFNPAMLLTVPYSTLGAGLVLLPTKDIKEAIVSLLVVQTNGERTQPVSATCTRTS